MVLRRPVHRELALLSVQLALAAAWAARKVGVANKEI